MKEKQIEQNIIKFLKLKGAVVEWMQGWSVMIKKWKYSHRMTLQTKWCPDIICFYRWMFIWIEVKKDEEQVKKWIKLKDRHEGGEILPKSYERQLNQIKYMEKIIKNEWHFMITCETKEIIDFIDGLK